MCALDVGTNIKQKKKQKHAHKNAIHVAASAVWNTRDHTVVVYVAACVRFVGARAGAARRPTPGVSVCATTYL